jgi:hypothetical protein
MDFGCDRNSQKNRPGGEPSQEGISTMQTLSPETQAATKVIAKACTWADRRRAAAVASADEKARALGLYKESGRELDEAVQKYRKAGQP